MDDKNMEKWCDCIFSYVEDIPKCKMCHKIKCYECSHFITKEMISNYLVTWSTFIPLQVLRDLQNN